MADTTALKNRIRAAIKANDNQEITGPVLQQSLLDIVDELNSGTETEANARQNADSSLEGAINQEGTLRSNADATLQQNINSEAQQRQNADTQLNNLIDRFYGSLVKSGTNLLSTPYPGYVDTSGNIIAYPNGVANYCVYPVVPILEDITYKYSGKISDDIVYAVAFYSSKGELIGGLKKGSLINNYTEGTIRAPKGAVFAIVSTKDTYKASLSPSESYYNNHTINVLAQINELINTLINTRISKINELINTRISKVSEDVDSFIGREFKAGESLLRLLTNHAYIRLSDGTVNYEYNDSNTQYTISALIPVKGGEEYNYIGNVADNIVAGIAFYTGDLQYIKGYGKANNIITEEVFTVTAPDNAVYALVCCYNKSKKYFNFYPTNTYYVLSQVEQMQDIQKEIQKETQKEIQKVEQDGYPYKDRINNVLFSLPTTKLSSNNVTVELVSTGMRIEPNAIKVTIGVPLPDTSVWNYFYCKYIGTFPAGKYVAFIRAKRIGTSTCRLQVFSNGGKDCANKTITDELTEDYQLFAVNCELTDDSNKVYVGVSAKYSFSRITEGDEIYMSLIGFAKNRTEKSIGSDIYTINDVLQLADANWNISYEASMAIFQGIPSIGMIGDSLMSGATYNHYDSDTPLKDREGCEWWRVLERESGAKYLDFAKGGQHTRSWLATFLNTATQEKNRCCAYIIGLGVNDAYALGDGYLGSQSDIDLDNSDNNGDTYYGNYAKIIQKLTEFNSRAKFFLLTEPRRVGDKDTKWNGAVRYIANLFDNCYLVDLQDMYNDEYTSGFINATKGPEAHYPYITYCYMAKLIERAIGKVIMDNAKDFVDIQFAAET